MEGKEVADIVGGEWNLVALAWNVWRIEVIAERPNSVLRKLATPNKITLPERRRRPPSIRQAASTAPSPPQSTDQVDQLNDEFTEKSLSACSRTS